MLLKFTTTDMLNTSLVNVATGERAYQVTTVSLPDGPEKIAVAPQKPFSSSQTTAVSEAFSPIKEHSTVSETRKNKAACRRTQIADATGHVVVDVFWEGRHPKITIDGEEIGGLNDLFGTSSVRFMPKVLAIPTKFSPNYIWTATAESLTLVDYSTEEVKGTFHQSVLRFPSPLKRCGSKSSLSTPTHITPTSNPDLTPPSPKSLFKSPSRLFSQRSSSSLLVGQTPLKDTPVKSTFVPTHVPGFGSNYLEFVPHPLVKDVEIILSFLIMEILRRGRFSLTPYTFENPTMWQLKEARDLVLRRIRRNTV